MPKSIYASGAFWQATAERAVSTVAQSGIAALGVDAATSGGLVAVNWALVGSIAGLAGVLSVLKSIAAGSTGNGPGFGDAEIVNPIQEGR